MRSCIYALDETLLSMMGYVLKLKDVLKSTKNRSGLTPNPSQPSRSVSETMSQ